MPRRARMYLPGLPYHIVQRGNNREVCFVESENYQFYLELWRECSKRYGVAVHAYCLMTNHIHFLVTPEHSDSISRATRVIGSRYAYYFNKYYSRTGTVWEGRHKSSLVQTDRYFLTCSRYIELNPVVAGMAIRPDEYKWSSYLINAWGGESNLIRHDEYLKLGCDVESRCYAYRELFTCQLSDQDIHLIENASDYCHPVSDDRFRQQIEKKYNIKLARTFHKYARALAGALFPQEIFLSRPDPLIRHSLGKFPEKTKSCAIIAAIHELFGLGQSARGRPKKLVTLVKK